MRTIHAPRAVRAWSNRKTENIKNSVQTCVDSLKASVKGAYKDARLPPRNTVVPEIRKGIVQAQNVLTSLKSSIPIAPPLTKAQRNRLTLNLPKDRLSSHEVDQYLKTADGRKELGREIEALTREAELAAENLLVLVRFGPPSRKDIMAAHEGVMRELADAESRRKQRNAAHNFDVATTHVEHRLTNEIDRLLQTQEGRSRLLKEIEAVSEQAQAAANDIMNHAPDSSGHAKTQSALSGLMNKLGAMRLRAISVDAREERALRELGDALNEGLIDSIRTWADSPKAVLVGHLAVCRKTLEDERQRALLSPARKTLEAELQKLEDRWNEIERQVWRDG